MSLATASLLNLHTWAPRDIRRLIMQYMNPLDRAFILCAHGLKWMYILARGTPVPWMMFYGNVKRKHMCKHDMIGRYASLAQLQWLCENGFKLSDIVLQQIVIRDDVALWQWYPNPSTRMIWVGGGLFVSYISGLVYRNAVNIFASIHIDELHTRSWLFEAIQLERVEIINIFAQKCINAGKYMQREDIRAGIVLFAQASKNTGLMDAINRIPGKE